MCDERGLQRRRTSSNCMSGIVLALFLTTSLTIWERKNRGRTHRDQPFDEASVSMHKSTEGLSAPSLDAVSSWCGVNAKRVLARDCLVILSSEFPGRGNDWSKGEDEVKEELFWVVHQGGPLHSNQDKSGRGEEPCGLTERV